MVESLATTAASQDTRLVILLRQTEDGTVHMATWGSEACQRNVEALGLIHHGLEAIKRLNAAWWDE
jgi:hypothetical protein